MCVRACACGFVCVCLCGFVCGCVGLGVCVRARAVCAYMRVYNYLCLINIV